MGPRKRFQSYSQSFRNIPVKRNAVRLAFSAVQKQAKIGMPSEYNYKMKTLVLFLKPTNAESSTMMDKVFQQCNFGYSHVVIEVPYPTTAAKNVFEKQQSISNMEYDGTSEDVMRSSK